MELTKIPGADTLASTVWKLEIDFSKLRAFLQDYLLLFPTVFTAQNWGLTKSPDCFEAKTLPEIVISGNRIGCLIYSDLIMERFGNNTNRHQYD